MRVLVKKWRSIGLRVIVYIDNGNCVAKNFIETRKAGKLLKKDLENAGFVLNNKKSIWLPTRQIKFLGFIVNTKKINFTVPKEKLKKMMDLWKKI